MQSLMVLCFLILVQPFAESKRNILEIFNEFCILIINYHLIFFTEYIED